MILWLEYLKCCGSGSLPGRTEIANIKLNEPVAYQKILKGSGSIFSQYLLCLRDARKPPRLGLHSELKQPNVWGSLDVGFCFFDQEVCSQVWILVPDVLPPCPPPPQGVCFRLIFCFINEQTKIMLRTCLVSMMIAVRVINALLCYLGIHSKLALVTTGTVCQNDRFKKLVSWSVHCYITQ